MGAKRSLEPMWWGLFSAGGVVAAFLVPVHVAVLGIAVPLGWVEPSHDLFGVGIVRLYLLAVLALPLYHWAHRFIFTLSDLGLRPIRPLLAVLCYGSAVAGTGAAVWIVVRL